MSQHHLILHGNILSPLTPVQQVFSGEETKSIFLSQGADFELFKEKTIAHWSYSLAALSRLIADTGAPIRIGMFVGGPTLLWIEKHAPKLNMLLHAINNSGAVEWIVGPMDHSLRFLYDRSGLEKQVYSMQDFILTKFGQRAKTLALPYFFYNTYLGYLAKKMGMEVLIVPPRSSSTISIVPHGPSLRLMHAQPWLPTELTQSEEHQIFHLAIDRLIKQEEHKRFFNWLKSTEKTSNWILPKNININGTPPEWDVQESRTLKKPLGSHLEALSHPYCKNWLKHLQMMKQKGIDIPELHNAVLFEAMLGYVDDQNPTEVYRSLLMRIKMLG